MSGISEIVHFYYRFILESKDNSHYSLPNDEKINFILLKNIGKNDFEKIWSYLNTDYLRRHSEKEVAWHIELIANNLNKSAVVEVSVALRVEKSKKRWSPYSLLI